MDRRGSDRASRRRASCAVNVGTDFCLPRRSPSHRASLMHCHRNTRQRRRLAEVAQVLGWGIPKFWVSENLSKLRSRKKLQRRALRAYRKLWNKLQLRLVVNGPWPDLQASCFPQWYREGSEGRPKAYLHGYEHELMHAYTNCWQHPTSPTLLDRSSDSMLLARA